MLKEQQERSRSASKFDGSVFSQDLPLTQKIKGLCGAFTGYDTCSSDSEIILLVKGDQEVDKLSTGEEGLVFLTKTPFYPEMGGQLSDKGTIRTPGGEFRVEEVGKVGEAIVHRGEVVKGEVVRGDQAAACVDDPRRRGLMRAHTGTHLLQAALRKVLGEHVAQQGSLVDEDRLRFDFTHFEGLSKDDLKDIERMVNERIMDGFCVDKRVLNLMRLKSRRF